MRCRGNHDRLDILPIETRRALVPVNRLQTASEGAFAGPRQTALLEATCCLNCSPSSCRPFWLARFRPPSETAPWSQPSTFVLHVRDRWTCVRWNRHCRFHRHTNHRGNRRAGGACCCFGCDCGRGPDHAWSYHHGCDGDGGVDFLSFCFLLHTVLLTLTSQRGLLFSRKGLVPSTCPLDYVPRPRP